MTKTHNIKNIFIKTANYQKTEDLVYDLLGPPTGVDIAALIGTAGRGKSSVAERIFTHNKNTIYCLYQEKWSHIELMREITFKLSGLRPRLRQTCFDIIQGELEERRRLILVDDADRANSSCLNVLRNIHDIFNVPILLIGEPFLERNIFKEKRIKSRVRNILFYDRINAADVNVFFKSALGFELTNEQTNKILKYCDGDFRPLITATIKADKIMDTSEINAVTDKIVDDICKDKRIGER